MENDNASENQKSIVMEKFDQLFSYVIEQFKKHPRDKGRTYLQHLTGALVFSTYSFVAGGCLLVHAIFPFLFVETGSNLINHLKQKMDQLLSPAQSPSSPPPAVEKIVEEEEEKSGGLMQLVSADAPCDKKLNAKVETEEEETDKDTEKEAMDAWEEPKDMPETRRPLSKELRKRTNSLM